jgi:hypothetical protein
LSSPFFYFFINSPNIHQSNANPKGKSLFAARRNVFWRCGLFWLFEKKTEVFDEYLIQVSSPSLGESWRIKGAAES